MVLIGDPLVPYEDFFFISSIDDIKNTNPNCTLIFDYDESLLTYCFKNDLDCAVVIKNIKQSIYCNALKAKYTICDKEIAVKIEKIAENYMFDSKVLSIIEDSDEIEQIALLQIDGIIYSKILKKIQ